MPTREFAKNAMIVCVSPFTQATRLRRRPSKFKYNLSISLKNIPQGELVRVKIS